MPGVGVLPIGRLLGSGAKRDSYCGGGGGERGGDERLGVLKQADERRRASLQNSTTSAVVGAPSSLAVAVGSGGGGSNSETISAGAFLKQPPPPPASVATLGEHSKFALARTTNVAAAQDDSVNFGHRIGRTLRLASQPTLLHVAGRSCCVASASPPPSITNANRQRANLALVDGSRAPQTEDGERRASDTALRRGSLLNWPALIAASAPSASPLAAVGISIGPQKRMTQRRSQPSIYAGRVIAGAAASHAAASSSSSSGVYSSQPHIFRVGGSGGATPLSSGSNGALRATTLAPNIGELEIDALRSSSATSSPLVARRLLPRVPAGTSGGGGSAVGEIAAYAAARVAKFTPRTLRRAHQSDLGWRFQRQQHSNSATPVGGGSRSGSIAELDDTRSADSASPSREGWLQHFFVLFSSVDHVARARVLAKQCGSWQAEIFARCCQVARL